MSVDQGDSWNIAQLPPVGHEQFYSILAANDEMVFMHVDEPGGQQIKKLCTFACSECRELSELNIFITILQCEGFYSSSREQLDLQHINLVLSNKLHSKVIHQSLIVIHSTSDDFHV